MATPQTFKITNCDLKECQRNTSKVPALRVYRAWNLDALERAEVAARSSSNIQIMRTFVRLREMLASNEHLIARLDELEENYDAKFKVVFNAIRQLMDAPAVKRKPIGFRPKARKK